jgi:hypothetical protein
VFGLEWGVDQTAVKTRFRGIVPAEEHQDALVYLLGAVVDRFCAEGSFCPTAVCSGVERTGDHVLLTFQNDQLAAALVSFGYAYETIGLKSEALSEQAMTAYARTELQRLIQEFSARYGPPALFTESNMRTGGMTPVGAALFEADGNGSLHVLFGFDGSGFTGELRYQSPARGGDGF